MLKSTKLKLNKQDVRTSYIVFILFFIIYLLFLSSFSSRALTISTTALLVCLFSPVILLSYSLFQIGISLFAPIKLISFC